MGLLTVCSVFQQDIIHFLRFAVGSFRREDFSREQLSLYKKMLLMKLLDSILAHIKGVKIQSVRNKANKFYLIYYYNVLNNAIKITV